MRAKGIYVQIAIERRRAEWGPVMIVHVTSKREPPNNKRRKTPLSPALKTIKLDLSCLIVIVRTRFQGWQKRGSFFFFLFPAAIFTKTIDEPGTAKRRTHTTLICLHFPKYFLARCRPIGETRRNCSPFQYQGGPLNALSSSSGGRPRSADVFLTRLSLFHCMYIINSRW